MYKSQSQPYQMPSRMVDSARMWKFQRFSAASSFLLPSTSLLQFTPVTISNTLGNGITHAFSSGLTTRLSNLSRLICFIPSIPHRDPTRRFLHRITIPLTVSYNTTYLTKDTPFLRLFEALNPKAPPISFLILNHVLWQSSENSSDISTLGLWLAVCAVQPDRKREKGIFFDS